jgi:hypothetical protein
MASFFQRHRVGTTVGVAVTFIFVTFPIWLAQVWGLFSERPFAVVLREQELEWLVITPYYGWFCLIVGMALLAIAVYAVSADPLPPQTPPVVPIGKHVLTVHSALYGISERDGQYQDVTDKVAAYAHKEKIDLLVTNEALNVGNPFQGNRKHLYVVYSVTSKVQVEERTKLTIPSLTVQNVVAPKILVSAHGLQQSVYGQQVVVYLGNLKGNGKEPPSIQISFLCFNGTNAKLSAKVSGKLLLYGSLPITAWTITEPMNVEPFTEFVIDVRMPISNEISSEILALLAADQAVEINLKELQVVLYSASGVSAVLNKPDSIQFSNGVKVVRIVEAQATLSGGGNLAPV